MERVNRERLLRELESVHPGLSPRGVIQQSSCFVFRKGMVYTFNDEVACSHSSCTRIKGVVEATPLLKILRELKEDDIELWTTKSHLRIKGKRKRMGISLEKKILLPYDMVEKPDTWKKLNKEFLNALGIVQHCAGKDESEFVKTCIHIHPKWIEASDNYHMARFVLKTRFPGSTLVRRDSIKHITELGMTRFALTDNWLHFKNPSGLVLSCKTIVSSVDPYPNLSPIFEVTGAPTTLPKGLGSAAKKAGVFSADNSDDDLILIELRPNEIAVRGEGDYGWYSQPMKVKFKGKPLSFYIPPDLLIDITKQHSHCELTEKLLKVDGGSFSYVTRLTRSQPAKKRE